MADYTNRASLWTRADGAKAPLGDDRIPPLFSGVLDVDGEKFQLSAWQGVPRDLTDEAKQAIMDFRKAVVALSRELGSDFSQERPGGSPILKLSIQKREPHQQQSNSNW